LTALQQSSTEDLDEPSDGDHHHKHSTNRCDEPLNPQPIDTRLIAGLWRTVLLSGWRCGSARRHSAVTVR
jgi:hypothetical protein